MAIDKGSPRSSGGVELGEEAAGDPYGVRSVGDPQGAAIRHVVERRRDELADGNGEESPRRGRWRLLTKIVVVAAKYASDGHE